MASVSAIAHNGDMLWFPRPFSGTLEGSELIFDASTVHPSFVSLLGASHLLYKVAANTRDMLNPAILLLEQHKLDAAVPDFLGHQSALETAMRCATHGIEKVLRERK